MTIQEQVDKALNNNVDLTDEEMQKEYEKADNITKTHGVKGKASVSESRRLKRITMNYYGSSLNIGASTLAALNNIEKLLYEQNVMLAGIYEKTVGTEERNGR